MQSNQPCPERFQVFTELPNGKGFKIKNSKYIYLFDKHGGWYDQYNNYYNPDGEHDDPPSDQDDDFERVILEEEADFDEDLDDFYQKQYGTAGYHSDEDNDVDNPFEADIAKNIAILADYPLKTALRVDFENMNFKVTKEDILKHYKSKVKGILNVIMTKQNDKFTGEGYFVCDDVISAEKLIKLQGQEFKGRKVYFDVESVDNFLMDPVTKQEKNIIIKEQEFESLVKEQPIQSKVQQPLTKEQIKKKKYTTKSNVQEEKKQKQSPKKQQKKQQEKIEQKPQPLTWSKYKGQFSMFPLKNSFFNWMSSLGFKEGEHFKNIAKLQGSDQKRKWKTIDIRSDALAKVQNTLYENQKVTFEKIN